MKNLEVYKFSGHYHFINNDTNEEAKIVLGSANRGGDVYEYVSHLEDCDDLSEEREQEYIDYLENNFELITNAKEL